MSKLLQGLSSTAIMDGPSAEEQLYVVAGKYDSKFPALRAAYVSALVDEMSRVILANEISFQQCASDAS
jgi:hypothetical protein